MGYFMKIPDLDENILGNPALTRGRERIADMTRSLKDIPGYADSVDEALLAQCEACNVFPKLRQGEAGAHISQVIFEIRGHLCDRTMRLLEFYEPRNTAGTIHAVTPLPVRASMRMLQGLHYADEQTVMIQTAFAARNDLLLRKHEMAIRQEDTNLKMSLAYRLMALEDSYKMVMRSIGAIPRAEPTLY